MATFLDEPVSAYMYSDYGFHGRLDTRQQMNETMDLFEYYLQREANLYMIHEHDPVPAFRSDAQEFIMKMVNIFRTIRYQGPFARDFFVEAKQFLVDSVLAFWKEEVPKVNWNRRQKQWLLSVYRTIKRARYIGGRVVLHAPSA
jgi:hypothetical protein